MKLKNISLVHSKNLPKVDYAYASRVPSNMELIFLAGSCPLDSEGKVPYPSDYEDQANLCMDNLKLALKDSDASLTDVVYTRVIVASSNQEDLVTAWKAIRKQFGEHDVPSTLSGVTVLGYKHQLVEIEAVAAKERTTK